MIEKEIGDTEPAVNDKRYTHCKSNWYSYNMENYVFLQKIDK